MKSIEMRDATSSGVDLLVGRGSADRAVISYADNGTAVNHLDPLIYGGFGGGHSYLTPLDWTFNLRRPRPVSDAGTLLERRLMELIASATETVQSLMSPPDNLADLTVDPVPKRSRKFTARVVRVAE